MEFNKIPQEQYGEGLKELIVIIGNELKRISEEGKIGENYLVICAMALELLEKTLGEEYDFPIDINKIAKKLNIHVFYQPLNSAGQNGRLHKMVGKLVKKRSVVTKDSVCGILIDEESDRETQRYGLAHELAHYLIGKEKELIDSEYHIMPMLFKDMEEMVADIFAIFLLIPIPSFLKEFEWYIGEDNVPVQTSEWLEYLGRVTEVPYEDVAIGYQNIRYVCGLVYGIKHELNPETLQQQLKEKISSRNSKVDEIVNKQVNNIIKHLGREGREGKLFC